MVTLHGVMGVLNFLTHSAILLWGTTSKQPFDTLTILGSRRLSCVRKR